MKIQAQIAKALAAENFDLYEELEAQLRQVIKEART